MKKHSESHTKSNEHLHPASNKALQTTSSPGNTKETGCQVRRQTSVQWNSDAPAVFGVKSSAASGHGMDAPRSAGRPRAAGDFRQNVMEFLHDMYGKAPLDDPSAKAPSKTPTRRPQEGMPPLPVSSKHLLKPSPRRPDPPLDRRALTHHGLPGCRSPILKSVPASSSVSEDHLDTLLDHIIDGYKRRSARAKKPVPSTAINNNNDGDVVSMFVSHALDNFLVKEASFSACNPKSTESFLSAGADGFFPKLLSFQAQSQMRIDDDESETLVKPVFDVKMATFKPAESRAGVSVSKSLPLGPMTPEYFEKMGTVAYKDTPISRNKAPQIAFNNAPRPMGNNSSFSRNMSLDSGGLNSKLGDSWGNDVEQNTTGNSVVDKKQGNVSNVANSKLPLVSSTRSLLHHAKTVKAGNSSSNKDEEIECLMHDEDLKRNVLMAVESRFRTYLWTLEKDEAAERVASVKVCAKDKGDPHSRQNAREPNAVSHQPMVQNLLDFFKN
ncbi:hypothetical protein DQ04_05301010 [Trypanosoma grayi]|uniref:hypothetical protein n=1 Tax=Trypanosoma grayi TaxID=71804 RepID=UPI0004F46925|nr:hypothetical protein DQ04_05301010 [Trypanosoma grayi]KEG09387.1 hypothetical protein DQ04_05301010 [Trypanosoma grayi]